MRRRHRRPASRDRSPRSCRPRNRACPDRRCDLPGSARPGRTPARARAHWRRCGARRDWPAPRRGRDPRCRRRCRGSRARPAPGRRRRGADRLRGWRAAAADRAYRSAAAADATAAPRRASRGAGAAGPPGRAADGRCVRAVVSAAQARAGGSSGQPVHRPQASRPADCGGAHRRHSHANRRAPRGRAGRPRIRPCARPLRATAARA